MKVVMVTPYPPKPDGIGEHTRSLVHALDESGDVEIDVLTCRRPVSDHEDTGVHRLLSLDPRSVRSSMEMLRSARPDVVHYQFAIPALGLSGLGAFVAGIRIRRELGTRLVITMHEVRRELDLLRGVGRILYRTLVRLADVVVVHTDESRELVVHECRADPNKVLLTPLGASDHADDLLTPSLIEDVQSRYGLTDRPVALCFGYLHPDKGIDHLVEAIVRLRSRAPAHAAEIDVLVAGAVRPRSGVFRFFERADHAYESELRRAVDDAGLADQVSFLGFVPRRDVPALFTLARAVVVPCTKVTQSSVLGSAIAAGAAVIASDLPGLRATLGDSGLLVTPGDPDALADALDSVMFDDGVAADLRARASRRRVAISLESVAIALADAYRGLSAGRSGAGATGRQGTIDEAAVHGG